MHIEPAKKDHIAEITAIYNREIETGFAHFALEPIDESEIEEQLKNTNHPFFVAIEDGELVGFAQAYYWKPRGAYQWTVQIGVYVKPEHQRKGIAKALYEKLFPACKENGFRTIVAGIALPNERSVKLHEAFGMKHAGTLPKMGFKQNEWRDVGYWTLHFEESMR